jgi:hypothetical protein
MEKQYLSVILRGFAVWLAVILAEGLHGTARLVLLQPIVGDFRARQTAVLTGVLIIFTISFLLINWIHSTNTFELLAVGLLWVVLTIAFEVLLGRFVMQFSWKRIFSDYDLASGGLMPFGLLFMFFAPLTVFKLKRKLSRRH